MPPMESEQLILYRLDQQDKLSAEYRLEVKQSLTRVFDQVVKTNGRVTALEKWRWICTGALMMISLVIGWWVTLHGK